MFIGRTNELNFLEKAYSSDKAEFIVLYGRRRIGKTELLKAFTENKPTVFYTCREYTDKKQFSTFKGNLIEARPDDVSTIQHFNDWEQLFSYFGDLHTDKKTVIIIDEFPYMCKPNESIPSILQMLWDHKLCHANIMLILCGSSMSFIEEKVLASNTPLYGRTTGIYKLKPLPYSDVVKFMPNYSDEDKLITYSVLGGIPHNLRQFDFSKSLTENITEEILTPGKTLYSEVEFLLHQELRETSVYSTILESIAYGNCKFSEIGERSQIPKEKLSTYLKNLLELGFVVREFPMLSPNKEKTKSAQGEYRISDPFFRFWFSYAYPYLTELETGRGNTIFLRVIQPEFHSFASKTFEELSIDYLRKLNDEDKLPFWFLSIGRWWGNITTKDADGKPRTSAEEIDILATDRSKKKFLLGECKFRNEAFDLAELKNLQRKNIFDKNAYYYLFALNGFTQAVKELSGEHVRLVTLSEITECFS